MMPRTAAKIAQPTPAAHNSDMVTSGWQNAWAWYSVRFAWKAAQIFALYGSAPGALVRWLFITESRISEMYTAAGFSCRKSLDHCGSTAGRLAMEYMTPQK